MRVKKTAKSTKTPFLFLVAGMFLLAIGISAGIVYYVSSHQPATTQHQSESTIYDVAIFSFQGADGWWQGATNVTSMALFNEHDHNGCFVSASYHQGTVDIKAERAKNQASFKQLGDDYKLDTIATHSMHLQTDNQPLNYRLQQIHIIVPPGGKTIKTGQEIGYVQLANGYVKLLGYCDTPQQLDTTLPALKAIHFSQQRAADAA